MLGRSSAGGSIASRYSGRILSASNLSAINPLIIRDMAQRVPLRKDGAIIITMVRSIMMPWRSS